MKILAVQNRMGIGDMIIFLPFIAAISKKFDTRISILVKESTRANEILKNNPFIDEIIILDRNDKLKKGKHYGVNGFFNLANDLKKYSFEKVFIFNSSLRFNLIMKLAKIHKIYQYKLFDKKNQNIIAAAQEFIKASIKVDVVSDPEILLDSKLVNNAKEIYNIDNKNINILLGIGGSGPTKRIPIKKYLEYMDLCLAKFDCHFFLATGKKNEEQVLLEEVIQSKYNNYCTTLDNLKIADTLPVIQNCNLAVCNDTSFSHISAALGIETIVLMSDTPLLYGDYSPKMHPIIPDGETTVKHKTKRKEKINPEKIFLLTKKILNLL